jgi:hypothetical protein
MAICWIRVRTKTSCRSICMPRRIVKDTMEKFNLVFLEEFGYSIMDMVVKTVHIEFQVRNNYNLYFKNNSRNSFVLIVVDLLSKHQIFNQTLWVATILFCSLGVFFTILSAIFTILNLFSTSNKLTNEPISIYLSHSLAGKLSAEYFIKCFKKSNIKLFCFK